MELLISLLFQIPSAVNHLNYLMLMLWLSVDGSTKRKWWIWCIVGILLAVALLLVSYLYYCYIRKRKLQQAGKQKQYRVPLLLFMNCTCKLTLTIAFIRYKQGGNKSRARIT